MDKIIILFLLIGQLTACSSQSWQELRVVALQPSSAQDYHMAAKVLEDRLFSAGVEYKSVGYLAAEQQIVIVLSTGIEQEWKQPTHAFNSNKH